MLATTHRRWVQQFLGTQPPSEDRATCDDCAMQGKDAHSVSFGRVKCCTYAPTLPNYLVGEILADRSEEAVKGRRAVLSFIHRGAGVSPFGLIPSRATHACYDAIVERDTFGCSDELACPFYLSRPTATCGIWAHRNAICATWFCKYERGKVGQDFWLRLRDVLASAETAVQRRCVLDLAPDPVALGLACTSNHAGVQVDTLEDPLVRARAWGSWFGREAEFYEACAERAAQFDWPDVLVLGGVSLELLVRLCVQAETSLREPVIPSALRLAKLEAITVDKKTVRLCTYLPCDPLFLPAKLFRALQSFDGRPVSSVLEELADAGIHLDDELLQQLVDFEVLVDPRE